MPSSIRKKSVAQQPTAADKKTRQEQVKKYIFDFNSFSAKDKMAILEGIGIGTEYFTCNLCGGVKRKKDFYASSDPNALTGITRICKSCAEKLVYSVNEYGEYHEPTKQTLCNVLEYLDKPFTEKLYESSIAESLNTDTGKPREDVWKSYIKNVSSLPQYQTLRWRDSDNFKKTYLAVGLGKLQDVVSPEEQSTENTNEYEVNKRDVIRFVNYDPFENYPRDDEKPRLYAQLVTFLDDETKNDGMKLAAVVQIVKRLNQAEKLNDLIDIYLNDIDNVSTNQPLINKMMDTAKKNMDIANSLAKDNGISVNFNNNKSKGANTLSGKIKALTELGFRDAKINTFDIGSCEGMKQVALISEEARHRQIGYDENIAKEIKDIKVELVEKLTRERDEAIERARILLVENKDLKSYMMEIGILDANGRLINNE